MGQPSRSEEKEEVKAKLTKPAQGSKNRLAQTLRVLIGRTLTRDDIVYKAWIDNCGPVPWPTLASVTVAQTEHSSWQTFHGQPCTSKKEAEESAAEQAVWAL